jgi:hypothetical protein
MPASLPGSTLAQNLANPSAGQAIIFDALSGPKGSPFDKDATGNASTGAMCTGIGFGLNAGNPYIAIASSTSPATAAKAISDAGFTDDQGDGAGAANSNIIYIGGGRSVMVSQAPPAGQAGCNPYTAGFVPGNAGNGGSRDAGAGPAFTSFTGKWVTAVGAVTNGSVVETGFVNRCGVTLAATQSVFGSASAAQAAPV